MGNVREKGGSRELKPITEIAASIGLTDDDLECYGRHKAKVRIEAIKRFERRPNTSLILVSAMTPTPAGEGKTTVSIGLSQALAKLGKQTIVTLREPSLGPVFGIKGGATGGVSHRHRRRWKHHWYYCPRKRRIIYRHDEKQREPTIRNCARSASRSFPCCREPHVSAASVYVRICVPVLHLRGS